ncbi:unnamed protein product [Gadus morhua 'NCC']
MSSETCMEPSRGEEGEEEEEEEEGEESGGDTQGGTVPENERLQDDGGSAERSSQSLRQSWDGALGGYMLASNSNRKSCPRRERRVRTLEPRGSRGPFYYIGGANGAKIVSRYCEDKGWQRIHDQHRTDYKLKWCEIKSRANYHHFREGHQLLYQIPNNTVLTSKIGLLSSLRAFERVSTKVNFQGLRRLKMEQFFPDTFRLDLSEEREAFFAQQNGVEDGHQGACVWICKPTGMNQGKGIFLLKTPEDVAGLRLRLQQQQSSKSNRGRANIRSPQAHIAQRYVNNPLLLEGRKFDVRSYLLIACTDPYIVFFRHGYARLTCDPYDPRSNNLTAHLTNQYMQKKNPMYSVLKEDTVWSMEKLNDYVNDTYSVAKGLPRDWITGDFTSSMKQIMFQCFLAVKSKLDRKLGLFDLLGCDFLIDEEFKVWLLEMNCNPALTTNCGVLQDVVPSMLGETLDITLEIFSKRLCGQEILPLISQRHFVLLYSSPEPLTRASGPGGRRRTPGGVQPSSTSKQNATTAATTTNTTPAIPNTTAPTATKRHDPAAPRRRSLGNTNRVRTSCVSGTQSEDIGNLDTSKSKSNLPETSSPSSTARHVPSPNDPCPMMALEVNTLSFPPQELTAASGRTETLSTHVCGLPLKSSHSRVELRLNKCLWPPPEYCIAGKKRRPKRANLASLPTTRELGEGTGGSKEERPGGALSGSSFRAQQTIPSPHPGRPVWTGSQEKGNEASAGGGNTGGCLPNGNKKGELRFWICK